ncbi:adipocyte plasma membrane-associated protein-like isoform X2 [Stegodyphus dumicola]|uniref:adipocyte plasma membrane-associated protein-like isoform X2 n=1 Tax=Stegodyphus dumicola TaxID=202533 RepID=UPI0015AD80F0|nr:adipocyte plasma membrane-associated protein-like isoform X2 [Stegodyphus dumicola]
MKTFVKILLLTAAIYLVVRYSPTFLDFRPKAYSIPFPAFRGPLEENWKLNEAERLFKGILNGPESIIFHDDMPYEERLCGRPLGLRKGKDGLLYVIDAYYGIFSMNFTTGALTRILPSNVLVEGRNLNFPDDLDIDDEGNIYFSDASRRWDLSTIYYLMTEYEGDGRVIKYNMNSGETEVLVRSSHFPNGVQLTHDKTALLICEISNRRILRYNLKGSKKGQLEIFADVLPGEPDNIRTSSRGTYWVGFTSARNFTNPLFMDYMNPYPTVKIIWARLHHAFGTLLVSLAEMASYPVLKEVAYKFKRGDYVLPLLRRHGLVIEFDENGKILRSFHSPDGKISDLSEVKEHDGYLYLGSFINDYLGRLKL